jgi:PTS system cellobiose-specific IIB component
MIRIILVCSAGMSTSILVNNMKKMAEPDDVIKACPLSELERQIEDFDVIMVGPQIRFQYDLIHELAQVYGKKAALMDIKAYSQMDGALILQQAHELMTGEVFV